LDTYCGEIDELGRGALSPIQNTKHFREIDINEEKETGELQEVSYKEVLQKEGEGRP